MFGLDGDDGVWCALHWKLTPRFITFEGIEGAGKSSCIRIAANYLEQCGVPVTLTREPGGCELAEAIRDVLLSPKWSGMAQMTELLLMFAARHEHIERRIRPALTAGQWVLCDRFTDATYAYQGGGRGIDATRIAVLAQWVQATLQPDLTFLLDVPADVGLSRARQQGVADRFEQEDIAFFQRVRTCYLGLAKAEPGRFRVIDTVSSLESVTLEMVKHLDAMVAASRRA